ncbi:hypothetical protein [Microbacterium sp.]|uniref:hypothetical protein n=1 Tax=Microbacterium sp. TaxID=51671 RepID=UPI002898FDB5|nr:hypothetical protein [Microbacterium sp.]
MKDDFLRPPATLGDWLADVLRLIGVLGLIAAAIWLKPTDAGIAALALPALMLPRILGLAAWFDVTACATVLVAAWSNVFDLYRTVTGWNLVLHFLCTGVLAVIAAVILTRTGVVSLAAAVDGSGPSLRRRTPVVLVPLVALAISAVWEMIEWLGWRYLSEDIFVTYQDTIGDMVLGGLGGIAAGILLALVPVGRR